MQTYRKLGVFLHDSPADDAALAFAGVLATLAQSDSVLCVRVREPDSEGPDPDVAAFEAAVRSRLPDEVSRITQVEIRGGTGVAEILRGARDLDLDMMVVGRRLSSDQLGIGTSFARLAHKAPCNVLVVPEGATPHLGRVLVPIDFSAHSKRALEQGLELARASGDAQPQLVMHSNSPVGYGYTKLGMSLAEAIAERERDTRQRLVDFVADLDTTGVEVEQVCTTAEDTEAAICEVAVARKMDLILVGSRGQSGIFLLGSTAERLLHKSMLPVLIVKEKGETVPFLDALFGTGS
jgi:nucleotide-binding universal stress UspA family protein